MKVTLYEYIKKNVRILNKYSFVEVAIKITTVHAVYENVYKSTIINKYFNQTERHFVRISLSINEELESIYLISCNNVAISPIWVILNKKLTSLQLHVQLINKKLNTCQTTWDAMAKTLCDLKKHKKHSFLKTRIVQTLKLHKQDKYS